VTTEKPQKIVILATGGTIAGLAEDVQRPDQYQAAQLTGAQLFEALMRSPSAQARLSINPSNFELSNVEWVIEQVAQVDSKAMTHALWRTLAQRCDVHLKDPEVRGIVITHGTDTAEETAFFLQCVLRPTKPVALTCAMRPANVPDADGPANLADALSWVAQSELGQVAVVVQGEVHAAQLVQKVSTQPGQAFSSGPHGPLTRLRDDVMPRLGGVTEDTPCPSPTAADLPEAHTWPRVFCVTSHAGVDGAMVKALMQSDAPSHGWVVAGTGAGTVHPELEQALVEAQAQGAVVWRASRCAWGEVPDETVKGAVNSAVTAAVNGAANGVGGSPGSSPFKSAGTLTPTKARIALMLHLMRP
jgi:L-asparaginase